MRWFRFYTEVVHDPKVQLLPDKTFKEWINVLCIAGDNGGVLPDDKSIAFTMHMTTASARQMLIRLKDAGLLDLGEDGKMHPHNWGERQFQSDVSTERVRRFRDKKKSVSSGSFGNDNETFQETDLKRPRARDTDTDTEYKPPTPLPKRADSAECEETFHRILKRHAENYRHAMKTQMIVDAWSEAIAMRPDDPQRQAAIIDKAHMAACSTNGWQGKYREALDKWLARGGYMDSPAGSATMARWSRRKLKTGSQRKGQ